MSFNSAAVSESISKKNERLIQDANFLYEALQIEKSKPTLRVAWRKL